MSPSSRPVTTCGYTTRKGTVCANPTGAAGRCAAGRCPYLNASVDGYADAVKKQTRAA